MKNKKKVDFKESILNVNFETQTAPVIQEAMGKDYIEYGTEDYKNLYPQFLIDLFYNSSTHAAIVNATADMIAGESITVEESDNLDAYVKLKRFLAQANSKGESLHSVVKKIAFDFKLQGAYALNVVWSKDRTEISDIYHIPVERIRMGKPDALGRVSEYYVSADWSNTRRNKPQVVPAFNVNDRTNPNAIIYDGMYSPNMQLYKVPDYVAACNWCLIDQKVAEFHLANIENGFAGSYFISFANGVPSSEERRQIENSIKKKFTGSGNAGKFVLTFSDDKNRTPDITPISVADADKQYLALQELLVQNILTGHRVTSPMLMGIKNSTGLGNNAEELNSAFEVFLNSVIKPFQNNILACLGKILEVNGINLPIEIVQNKPITTRFTIEDMKEVMTTDEIRSELGLKSLEEEELTADEEDKRQKYAKVGSMITDGKELPLFDTIEEAEAEAEKLGCKGYHEHTQDGNTYYMPCENHEDITNLQKCDCTKPSKECKKKCDSYEDELDKFIAEFGEDAPEGYELIDEERVEDEDEDFDFEKELNEIHRLDLATTGTARPNARSEQDGIDKNYNLYKVRYEYAEDTGLTRESGKSREFCTKMLAANKMYRKEDLIRLENIPVNKGWGKGGADTYSIWKFKGGGSCHHYFRRKIWKFTLGVSRSGNLEDGDVISTAKARKSGFYPKANDKKVAQAPKRMPNKGFIK
jgi:hypothetical protein